MSVDDGSHEEIAENDSKRPFNLRHLRRAALEFERNFKRNSNKKMEFESKCFVLQCNTVVLQCNTARISISKKIRDSGIYRSNDSVVGAGGLMQVKILTRTMKVKSEHHKVSGSSSAKAHRIRAANLPSHRLSEIQRSEVVRSAGGN